MSVLFLTNNPSSLGLAKWISARDPVTVLEGPVRAEHVLAPGVDLVVSYNYRHMIRSDVLDALPGRVINLHVSLLPFNRGSDPNIWSFLDDTRKGVTIHLVDTGLDTGPILCQREVEFDEDRETLASAYTSLQAEIVDLFKTSWVDISSSQGPLEGTPQTGPGTTHRKRDLAPVLADLLGPEGWDIPIPLLKLRYASMLNQ